MIYWLAGYLEGLGEAYDVFRVLQYTTVRSIGAVITTLGFMLIAGPHAIRLLFRAGQRDNQRFDAAFATSKRGTPTMGGVIILAALLLSLLLWGNWASRYLWVVVSSLLVFGGLGAIDDLAKVRGFKKGAGDTGLSRKAKLLVQTVYGLFLGWFLFHPATTPFPVELADTIGIVFLKPASHGGMDVHLWYGYILFVAFVVVAVSNAVNLIDGLDGLAAGTAIAPFVVYGVFAFILSNINLSNYLLYPFMPGSQELVVFVSALSGALVGFLWFNGYPAEVFMGDTGSLSLGGMMATMIILTKQELLFVIAGGLFIFVNATHIIGDRIGLGLLGRRIFYRLPIHHTYQHLGMAETKVVIRFWIVSLILALLALSTLKLR